MCFVENPMRYVTQASHVLHRIGMNKLLIKVYKFFRTADSEHCFDLSGLISAVGVTKNYLRQ